MDAVYVAEIHSVDASGAAHVLLAGSDGWCTRPDDTPPDAVIEPRLRQPANYRRDLWGSSGLFGAVAINYGECVLDNADGGLDALAGHAFDGREFVLRVGPRGGAYPAQFAVVLRASTQAVECSLRTVTVRLRDALALLDRPACTALYAGTGGAEGAAGTAQQRKPVASGTLWNAPLKLLDRPSLLYQAGLPPSGHESVVVRVLDMGVDLAPEGGAIALGSPAVATSVTDLLTAGISSGHFRVYPPAGLVALGSPPAGEVTCVVRTLAAGTWAQDVGSDLGTQIALLATAAGVVSIDAADVAALDALTAVVHGVLVTDETTTLDAVGRLAASVGAWVGVDRLGVLRMGQLAAPTGPAAEVLTVHDCFALERVVSGDPGRGVPVWRVTERYRPNWGALSSMATSLDPAAQDLLRAPWRTRVWEDASVLSRHPLASEVAIETLITGPTLLPTPVEGGRRLALLAVDREVVTLEVEATAQRLALLDLGAVVELRVPRYGWGAGKLFVVTGIGTDLARGRIDLTLWG